jgi:hypothetical protein
MVLLDFLINKIRDNHKKEEACADGAHCPYSQLSGIASKILKYA